MASIYTLTVKCVRGPSLESECVRVIEMDSSSSLQELHLVIQRAVDFDNDHLYGFFLGNASGGKREAIAPEHRGGAEDGDDSAVTLEKVFPTGRKRLFYLFDFGDNWLFEIRKARGEKEREARADYPRIVEAKGANPEQYPDSEW